MKSLKNISLIIFFISFISGCGLDDKYITEDEVKAKIDRDLQGKLWKATRYVEVIKNDKGEAINYVNLPLDNSPLKSVTFKNMAITSVGSFKEHLPYHVSNVVGGLEVEPEIYVLEIKEGTTVYFNMLLKNDYTNFTSDFKLKSTGKSYIIDFKLE